MASDRIIVLRQAAVPGSRHGLDIAIARQIKQ